MHKKLSLTPEGTFCGAGIVKGHKVNPQVRDTPTMLSVVLSHETDPFTLNAAKQTIRFS